ncbi:MAG: DUF1616 domain-containing protein [Candidatus Bathyarchaeia archaeon]|jgi:uncharacterized membrane protein
MEKDLLTINALSIILILTIVWFPESPLRTLLGVPFVLFFPGYVLMCLLFPLRKDLGDIERLALSVGLSLAVVPLVGLAMNYSSWGIRLLPMVTSIFILTLLLSLLTNYRRAKLPAEQKLIFVTPKLPTWNTVHNPDKILAVGFLIVILAVVGLAVYFVFALKTSEQFTEFYVLGSNGELADYPVNLTLGETGVVTLGITNHEFENLTYKIVVKFENQTLDVIGDIPLDQGLSWNQTYSFTPQVIGEKLRLQFQLYKQNLTEVYRSCHLWINVQPQA